MYTLVSRVPDGLNELKSRFETHVHSQGLAAVEKIGETATNVCVCVCVCLSVWGGGGMCACAYVCVCGGGGGCVCVWVCVCVCPLMTSSYLWSSGCHRAIHTFTATIISELYSMVMVIVSCLAEP